MMTKWKPCTCWRFFAEDGKPANILLESGASIRASDLDALGNDFEKTTKGYIDFLLLDDKGRPCIVLTQRPGYASEAGWKIADEQPVYIQTNKLRFLRDYQLDAVHI